MPAVNNTELISFKDWTLRVRTSSVTSPRLLVLIHGWTGDENSMWVFVHRLSPAYWMIAPRAPHPAEPSGFSWRPPPPVKNGRPTIETLKPAAEALVHLVDEYATSVKVDAAHFDLMGFSQGAAMVNLVGMLYPDRVRKMGVLAGFIPYGADELVARQPLMGKNVFVAHGTYDKMVPIDRARASIALLEQAGARVTYCEDEVGHKVSLTCLHALENYLQD